jgi:cysteinyl-tRNA synthetase
LNFTFEALKASQNSLNNLYQIVSDLKIQRSKLKFENQKLFQKYKNQFLKFLNDDLNVTKALALM